MTPTDIRDTEIPEDVMEAARAAHADYARSSVTDNLTTIIARAIMAAAEAERERCAKIAEDEDGAITHWGEDRNTRVSQKTGRDIAAAIRAGTKGASHD